MTKCYIPGIRTQFARVCEESGHETIEIPSRNYSRMSFTRLRTTLNMLFTDLTASRQPGVDQVIQSCLQKEIDQLSMTMLSRLIERMPEDEQATRRGMKHTFFRHPSTSISFALLGDGTHVVYATPLLEDLEQVSDGYLQHAWRTHVQNTLTFLQSEHASGLEHKGIMLEALRNLLDAKA